MLLNHRDALVMDVRMSAMLALTDIRSRIVSHVHRLRDAPPEARVNFAHQMIPEIDKWYHEYDAIISM